MALGRAIVREPAAFLFDEPLSNLDAKLRTSMRGELIKLHRRLEATIVYVTHDQVEAMTMGETIVVMKDGIVQQRGAPLDVYGDPDNRFVAEFIGSPAMNFLEGRLESDAAVAATGALRIALSPAERRPAKGEPVVFGIRPEHIQVLPAAGGTPDGAIAANVVIVEPLGAETIIELDAGGSLLLARVAGEPRVSAGEPAALRIDPARLFVFDKATGTRIRSR